MLILNQSQPIFLNNIKIHLTLLKCNKKNEKNILERQDKQDLRSLMLPCARRERRELQSLA